MGRHAFFSRWCRGLCALHPHSSHAALFVYEERALPGLGQPGSRLSLGGRWERALVESLGNPQIARFGTGNNSFPLASYALGGLLQVAPAWQMTSNLSYTERAPKDYELFANGPHGATGAYELGDASFGKERATSVDLGLGWKRGPESARLTAYYSRFKKLHLPRPNGHAARQRR